MGFQGGVRTLCILTKCTYDTNLEMIQPLVQFFKLIFKNNKFHYLYYQNQTLSTRTSEMSLIKLF
jgi:hypothetical protein